MPQINLTITISVIITLVSLLSPIITTKMNNRHQFKLKKLEQEQLMYERTVMYKRNIFENYLKGLSQLMQTKDEKSLSLYAEYYPLAYMYLPEEIQCKMSQINQFVTKRTLSEILPYIDDVSKDIHTELQKL